MSQRLASNVEPIPSEWFQAVPVGLLQLNEKLECVAVNAAWLEVSTPPDGNVLGGGWLAAFHSDSQASVLSWLRSDVLSTNAMETAAGNQPARISVFGKHDGSSLQIQASALLTDAGTRGVMLAIVGDSEFKASSPSIASPIFNGTADIGATRLVEILDSTPDFVCVADSSGKVTWQNRRLHELRPGDLNSTAPSLLWTTCTDWANATLRDIAVPHANANGSWVGDLALLDERGVEWPVSMVLLAHKSVNGEVESYSAIMRDIQERKQVEEALRESESKFQKISDNIPGMIYRCIQNPDGTNRYTYVSHHVAEIFEVAAAEVLKDPAALRKRIHEDDLERYRETLQESFQAKGEYRIELRLQLPSSGTTWISSLAHATPMDDGSVVWDGFVVDITDRKEAEMQLQSTNDQLARATRHKDRFLANMSHELRTPLSAILSAAEGLQAGVYASMEAVSEAAGLVERSGQHLLALINDVLDVAKVESGKMSLQLESVSVHKLCESSLSFVEQQAKQKGVRLQFNSPWSLREIEVDPRRVRQILINLLSNAVKFTSAEGHVTLHVEHQGGDSDTEPALADKMLFSILDTGIGIPKDEIQALFLPFTQGDRSLGRDNEGTGLGLALAKQFAELHSGKLSVSSEPGVGSCFTVELPTKQSPEAWAESGSRVSGSSASSDKRSGELQPPSGIRAEPTDVSELNRNSKTVSASTTGEHESGDAIHVLLADDNEGVASGLSAFLRACGYQVSLASNGDQAVELAVRHQPDVILMDVQMPGKDGLTAIREIRDFPELQRTPIVALTALAMRDDEELCLRAGANRYVSKPVKLSELAQIIEHCVTLDQGKP